MRIACAVWLGSSFVLGGCMLDDLAPARSLNELTVVAIVAEPAEALPGEQVSYRAFVASPDGPVDDPSATWSLCRTPRSLSENAAVAPACATSHELPIGLGGLAIDAMTPSDACARFGPETSAGLRPNDPDQSGGYYQPVRVQLGRDLVAVHRQRIQCALANASFDVVRRFQQEYRRNRTPGILSLRAVRASDRAPWPVTEQGIEVPAGEPLDLELALAPDAAETYVVYEPLEARLTTRLEALDVRWFASAGELQEDRSVPSGAAAVTRWTPPESPRGAWVWAVLREDRGGVSAVVQKFEVRGNDAARHTPE